MAEIDVKNKSSRQGSETGQGSQTGSTSLQRQETGGGGLSRSRGWDPFEISPVEFFNNPFVAMRRLSEEMDRSFGRFFGQPSGGGTHQRWYPAVEVRQQNGQLEVCAELPGLNPEDVKVEVTNDALVIHGERKYEQEKQEGGAYRSERRYGEFYREIALPEGVNTEQARAQFRNGVLEVTLPMPEQASRRRQIPIQSGSTTSTGTSSAAAAGSSSTGTSGGTSTSGSSTGTGSTRTGSSQTK